MTLPRRDAAKRWWADTLFKRLFLLMWAALVVSHLCAFLVVHQVSARPGGASGLSALPPVLPALPPGGLAPGPPRGAPPPGTEGSRPPPPDAGGPPDGLPLNMLWLDYFVRFVIIGAAAWAGARWLASPMRRLARASEALGRALTEHQPAPPLDEQRGTLEVRRTAQVFNTMAQRLHEQFDAQGLLLAAISHDLRTPLARLRLRLEQMAGQPQAERCIADLQEMDSLIGSVLDMMRSEHTGAPRQRVDVLALLQSLADNLAEQGAQVSVTGPDAVLVRASPAALKRVFGNLIGNALRHGGSAEVAVALRHDEVHITVDDRGPGIPAHQLEAVFQPFYRVDASRSRSTAGTGLGLYIARDLTQRNGGRLTLTNRAEGGLRAEVVMAVA